MQEYIILSKIYLGGALNTNLTFTHSPHDVGTMVSPILQLDYWGGEQLAPTPERVCSCYLSYFSSLESYSSKAQETDMFRNDLKKKQNMVYVQFH